MTPSRFVVAAVITLGLTPAAFAQNAPSAAAPTYSKDVAPILFAQCTTCHRPGEIAPMSLLTYKDARPWARSIAAKVADGTMPPWHADPAYGQFSNERRLTAAQKDTIATWVAAGAPEGDAKDLPAAPKYAEGWRIGQPDAVLSMQEDYPIPASGHDPVPVLRSAGQLHRGSLDPGVGTAARQSRRRPPRDRLHAHARRSPRASRRPRRRGPRPAPIFTFADGMEIPGRTDRRSATAGRPASGTRPERSSASARHRRVDRRLRPRQLHPRLPRRHGDAAAGGLLARLPDALHDDG